MSTISYLEFMPDKKTISATTIMLIIILLIIIYILHKMSKIKTVEHFNEIMIDHFNKTEHFGNVEKIYVGDNSYKMQGKFSNKKNASIFMNDLTTTTISFINKLKRKYPDNPAIIRLASRFNPKHIIEVDPENKDGNTSFILNKGEEIGICIRHKNDPTRFTNRKVTLFVIIHELSHLASKGFGHGKEFKNNFDMLLTEADNMGIYKNIDFSKNPQMYCGMKISEKPINMK